MGVNKFINVVDKWVFTLILGDLFLNEQTLLLSPCIFALI